MNPTNSIDLVKTINPISYNTSTGTSVSLIEASSGKYIQKRFDHERYFKERKFQSVNYEELDAAQQRIRNAPGLSDDDKKRAIAVGVTTGELEDILLKLDMEVFSRILKSCGIESPENLANVSILSLLRGSNGEIDIQKARSLLRQIQERSGILVQAVDEPLITRHFDFILEGLNLILLNHEFPGKAMQVTDIRIRDDLTVELIIEYIEGTNLVAEIKAINLEVVPGKKLERIQTALGAILDTAALIKPEHMIHFDIKPANIFVADGTQERFRKGRGVLIDLGSAYITTDRINKKSYSFNDQGILSSQDEQNVTEDTRVSHGSTPTYMSQLAGDPGKVTDMIQADSFAYTLTCLETIDLDIALNMSRDYLKTVMASSMKEVRDRLIEQYITAIKNNYATLWDNNENEQSKSRFYSCIEKLLGVGIRNEDQKYAASLSANLIPMYFYALYQCIGLSMDGKWSINPESLVNVESVIDLASMETSEFTNSPDFIASYVELIEKEPLFSASKRSLSV